jgi:hypothetical protein
LHLQPLATLLPFCVIRLGSETRGGSAQERTGDIAAGGANVGTREAERGSR